MLGWAADGSFRRHREGSSRLVHFEWLRATAVLAVVVLHVSAPFLGSAPSATWSWETANVYSGLTRFCVPVMVMVSGVFFLAPEKDVPVRRLFDKYLRRIAVAFLAWSAIYVVVSNVDDPADPGQMLAQLLSGPSHFWFLFMLVGLYLGVPVMRAVAKNGTATTCFLVLWACFGVVGPTITSLPGVSCLADWGALFQLHLVTGFPGYLLLGLVLARTTISPRLEALLYVGGLLGVVSSVLLSRRSGELFDVFDGSLTITVALASTAVFVFFTQRVATMPMPVWLERLGLLLGASSFGVYLVHMIVLEGLARAGLSAHTFDPLFAIPGVAAVAFAVSALMVMALRRSAFARTYLV